MADKKVKVVYKYTVLNIKDTENGKQGLTVISMPLDFTTYEYVMSDPVTIDSIFNKVLDECALHDVALSRIKLADGTQRIYATKKLLDGSTSVYIFEDMHFYELKESYELITD